MMNLTRTLMRNMETMMSELAGPIQAQTGTVSDITDEELLRRAVTGVRPRKLEPKWSVVADLFCLGSTYSRQLCQRFDIDPDQNVRRK